MDNRIFNVNGSGHQMLLNTLKLVFEQEGGPKTTCKAWAFTKKHGLILFWSPNEDKSVTAFPAPMTAEQCFPFVESWLKSEAAGSVELKGWDANADHDGSNGEGWRVYCEDWGHVNQMWSAICAIKPAVMWYGK